LTKENAVFLTRLIFMRSALTLVVVASSGSALAQRYPDRPVRIVVSQSAGGSIDIAARALGAKLADALGQQVVIDNRPGANGIIATDAVAKAKPDGYTLLMSSPGPLTINPYAYKSVPYDTLRDLAPITQTTSISFLMVVSATSRYNSVEDVLAEARAKPGALQYGSAGIGNQSHLAPELFAAATKTRYLHVPYRGEAPAIADLMGGQVQFMIGTMPALVAQVRAGKLRALAVCQPTRSRAVPDVPTMRELGHPAVEIMGWTGVLAPAGTPADIITRLHAEITKIVATPDMREFLAKQGAEPVGSTPAEFTAFIRNEGAKWGKVIREAGISMTD
jgi:tripartite-type tricarboxylate transporter receptor subunit TctC